MKTTIQYIKSELKNVYPETEIQGLTRIILEFVTGWNFTQQQFNRQTSISETQRKEIIEITKRLKIHEPIQYILGETEFYGLKLKVAPAVLIPRPETEELVKLVLDKNENRRPRILDIGTGSGCIALALKNNLSEAEISGVDISDPALDIARENARLNRLEVNFFNADILRWEKYEWNSYDIIVSNPPYVRESEKVQMHENVLNFEPQTALFVADSDPLIFYRKIAEFAKVYLIECGRLFFEINENLAEEMYDMLNGLGFREIELNSDINEKKRMMCGIK